MNNPELQLANIPAANDDMLTRFQDLYTLTEPNIRHAVVGDRLGMMVGEEFYPYPRDGKGEPIFIHFHMPESPLARAIEERSGSSMEGQRPRY